MKKTISIISFYFFCLCYANGQEIVYKTTTQKINDASQALILKELSKSTCTFSLFENYLIVGPRLWEKLKDKNRIKNIEGGNVTLKVPIFDNAGNLIHKRDLEAKMLQDLNDFKIIWINIIELFNNSSIITFRPLNEVEKRYYWSVINYDIEEPIFIAEQNNIKLLIDINDKKIIWIDLVD